MSVNAMGYRMLLVAPFGPTGVSEGRWWPDLDGPDGIDAAMDGLAGTFRVDLPEAVGEHRAVDVAVNRLADFRPVGMTANCPLLRRIREAATLCDEAVHAGLAPAALAARLGAEYGDLPLDLSLAASTPAASSASPAGAGTIDAILGMVADVAPAVPPAASGTGPAAWKAGLDSLAATIVGAILADPAFRAAEAAWRGVRRILVAAGPDSGLSLTLVPAAPDNVLSVFGQLAATPPQPPYHLILVDALLDAAPARLAVWSTLAASADAGLTPVAVGLSPAFFHLDNWEGLSKLGHPARAMEEPGLAKWRKLAGEPGGDWLGAFFIRAALRAPYGPGNPARVAAVTETEPLWAASVWLLGEAVAASLARYGWPHRFEIGSGVVLGDLAVTVAHGRGMAVEALLGDERVLDFASVGLTALAGRAGGDQAFFLRAVTLDGSPLADRLFLGRVLGFFFASRQEAHLAVDGPEALAEALRRRFARFFETTGHPVPTDLRIEGSSIEDGIRLAIGFTPPRALATTPGRLEFSFVW